MNNYKIKVNDLKMADEVQELFEQIGYEKKSISIHFPSWISNFHECNGRDFKYTSEPASHWLSNCQELTLPQLRDLVVLKRKDINDANFLLRGNHYYKSSRGDWYFYGLNSWQHSTLTDLEGIEPILKEKPETNNEQGLISGADGKEVEANNIDFGYWIDARNLNVTDFFDDIHTFRLKPRTITLSLAIPAPFEPKLGETAYFLSTSSPCGYTRTDDFKGYGFDSLIQFGAWRTEEEIKQVVAALRGIKG